MTNIDKTAIMVKAVGLDRESFPYWWDYVKNKDDITEIYIGPDAWRDISVCLIIAKILKHEKKVLKKYLLQPKSTSVTLVSRTKDAAVKIIKLDKQTLEGNFADALWELIDIANL